MVRQGRLEHLCDILLKKLEEGKISDHTDEDSALNIMPYLSKVYASHPSIQTVFPSFEPFLNQLLDWSYGLHLNVENKGIPVFDPIPPAEKDNRFLHHLDVLALIPILIKNYTQKYQGYNGFRLEHTIHNEKDLCTLVAGFNADVWDNIYNDFKDYSTVPSEKICIMNDERHALAAYLHSAHPRIHYLTISDKEKKLHHPLATAILIEQQGKNASMEKDQEYLLVEGVLAHFSHNENDPEKGKKYAMLLEKKEEVYDFVWESIFAFAEQQKKKGIFVNTCHSGNQIEPEEFVAYVAKRYDIAGAMEKKGEKMVFYLQKPEKVLKGKGGKKFFTHYFSAEKPEFAMEASNNTGAIKLYHGEQYADTFFLDHKKEFPEKEDHNSFTQLQGKAQGFEILLPEDIGKDIVPSPAHPKKQWSIRKRITAGITALLTAGTISLAVIDKYYRLPVSPERLALDPNKMYDQQMKDLEKEINILLKEECNGQYDTEIFYCQQYSACARLDYADNTNDYKNRRKCIAGWVDLPHINVNRVWHVDLEISYFSSPVISLSTQRFDDYTKEWNDELIKYTLKTEQGAKRLSNSIYTRITPHPSGRVPRKMP